MILPKRQNVCQRNIQVSKVTLAILSAACKITLFKEWNFIKA